MVALAYTRSGLVAVVILAATHGAVASGQSSTYAKYRDASLPIPTRVADLLGRMTLEEKVAQLLHPYVPKYHFHSTPFPLCLFLRTFPSLIDARFQRRLYPNCTTAAFITILLIP